MGRGDERALLQQQDRALREAQRAHEQADHVVEHLGRGVAQVEQAPGLIDDKELVERVLYLMVQRALLDGKRRVCGERLDGRDQRGRGALGCDQT